MTLIKSVISSISFSIKNIGSSITIVTVLSIGIGMCVMMFALVNGFLWTSPIEHKKDRLVLINWEFTQSNNFVAYINVRDFRVMKEESNTMKEMAAYQSCQPVIYNPEGNQNARRYSSTYASVNFFDVIDVKPILGRTFHASDSEIGYNKLVVISEQVWREQLGSREDVIGSSLLFNGVPREVIGVMPDGFKFPYEHDIWVPTEWHDTDDKPREKVQRVAVFGLIDKSFSQEVREQEFNSFAKRFREEFPDTNGDYRQALVEKFHTSMVSKGDRSLLPAMLVCGLLVLFVAIANTSNLILGRTFQKSQELALRQILGAKRMHVVLQVLIDGIFLSSIASCLGLILASWGGRMIMGAFAENGLPYWWHMSVDAKVLLFVACITILSGMLSSLFPALRITRKDNVEYIKDSTRTSSGRMMGKITKLMVAAQIALSFALIITAMVSIIMMQCVINRPLCFDSKQTLSANMDLNSTLGFEGYQSVDEFYENLKNQVLLIPGVEHAGYVSGNVEGLMNRNQRVEIEGVVYEKNSDRPMVGNTSISLQGFDVFAVKPIVGRFFQATDIRGTELVAVVNHAFAESYLKNQNPIGKRFRSVLGKDKFGDWVTIVGVTPDLVKPPLPGTGLQRQAAFYLPHLQTSLRSMYLVMNGRENPEDWVEPLRKTIRELSPGMALRDNPQTIHNRIKRGWVGLVVIAVVLFIFGVATLIISSAGLYAVIAFNIRQRKREFGIRMALGARRIQVLIFILRKNLIHTVTGLVLGLFAGITLGRLILQAADLSKISIPTYAYGGVSLLVVTVCLLAIMIPALRITRMEVAKALHVD